MQKLVVFGTYHDVAGLRNFPRQVNDPDYRTILARLIEHYEVDFIFEEAAQFGPSIAFEMSNGRYVDIDVETTEEALARFAEPPERRFLPEIFGGSELQQIPTKLGLPVQEWRESCWARRIREQQFQTGLVICGVLHTLSIAFHLKEAGFDDVEAFSYEPIERLLNPGIT